MLRLLWVFILVLIYLLLAYSLLGAFWLANTTCNYRLHFYSFLAWGMLLFTLCIMNFVLRKDTATSPSIDLVASMVCMAIGFYARKKSVKKRIIAASTSVAK